MVHRPLWNFFLRDPYIKSCLSWSVVTLKENILARHIYSENSMAGHIGVKTLCQGSSRVADLVIFAPVSSDQDDQDSLGKWSWGVFSAQFPMLGRPSKGHPEH